MDEALTERTRVQCQVENTRTINRGSLLAYRVFDFCDEISLEKAEERTRDANVQRRALTREGAQSLVFAAPPLNVPIGWESLKLRAREQPVSAYVSARLFAYGAISLSFEVRIEPGTPLGDLAKVCDELYDTPLLELIARPLISGLLTKLGDAATGLHEFRETETYTVIFVEEMEGSPTAAEVLKLPLANLLLGEDSSRRLAPQQRDDVLKHSYSYFEDDLVIIDWNSAFVLEPSGSRDVPDILEFATSQLLELRYYDDVFDRELSRIYDGLERVKRTPFAFFFNPHAQLARVVTQRLVELNEFTERVDNALKVTGDFYLARVYHSAVNRFRINAWQASIDAKQALFAQAFGLIKGEIDTRRSTFLEIIVVTLIFLELALAAWKR